MLFVGSMPEVGLELTTLRATGLSQPGAPGFCCLISNPEVGKLKLRVDKGFAQSQTSTGEGRLGRPLSAPQATP